MDDASVWRELGARFAELTSDGKADFDAEHDASGRWFFKRTSDEAVLRCFTTSAERAAALLGCPPETLSVSFWLDELKRNGTHYEFAFIIGPGWHGEPGDYEAWGIIRRVCFASADYCYRLETYAIASERPPNPTLQNTTNSGSERALLPDPKPHERLFRERAKWLKDQLKERAWDRNDPARHLGPDPKTIDRILKGLTVRADVLERLANALSTKGDTVKPVDIPDD
jgi:hypothetical protein